MLQFILNVAVRVRDALTARAPDDCELWRIDPLAHPALRRMSARDLGDLPTQRYCGKAARPQCPIRPR